MFLAQRQDTVTLIHVMLAVCYVTLRWLGPQLTNSKVFFLLAWMFWENIIKILYNTEQWSCPLHRLADSVGPHVTGMQS